MRKISWHVALSAALPALSLASSFFGGRARFPLKGHGLTMAGIPFLKALDAGGLLAGPGSGAFKAGKAAAGLDRGSAFKPPPAPSHLPAGAEGATSKRTFKIRASAGSRSRVSAASLLQTPVPRRRTGARGEGRDLGINLATGPVDHYRILEYRKLKLCAAIRHEELLCSD